MSIAAITFWGCRSRKTCNTPQMLAFLASLGLLGVAWAGLRGGFAGSVPGLRRTGLDPNAVGLAAVAIAAAIWFFGWAFGIAFVLAVMLHEYGHVAAFRVCGHRDATFRLLPLVGGQAISSRLPSTHLEEVFISLMGPAIGLAPMLVLITGSDLIWDTAPRLAYAMQILAMVIAGLNAFNLMPFWPLDGGKILRILVYTYLPGAAMGVTLALSALAGALAILTQSYFLFIFVLLGLSSLMQSGDLIRLQRPMTRPRGLLALGAYLATTAAYAMVALPLLAMLHLG